MNGQLHESNAPADNDGQQSPPGQEDASARAEAELPAPREAALCFSGGGIRSATFNLGVLQELARNGWLKRFDLLSTVSGGGYIGAWFVAQIARARSKVDASLEANHRVTQAQTVVIDDLARSDEAGELRSHRKVEHGVDTASAIAWLRAYSNYLSPTWGLSKDALTLAAIYLRNLVIHWMILIPVLLAVLLLPRVVHLIVLDPKPYASELSWLIILSVVLMGAFSTNGPPAPGEHRSRWINLLWHAVCFVLPLLVIPIGLTAFCMAPDVGKALLEPLQAALRSVSATPADSVLDSSTLPILSAGFACAGAGLYLLGGVLALMFRGAIALIPDVKDGERNTWVGLINRLMLVDKGVSARGNFKHWIKRFPLRVILSLVTGALAGGFCGVAFFIASPSPLSPELTTALLPVLFVLAIWLASVLRVAIATRRSSEPAREWWARATGASLIGVLVWVVLAVVVLWLPLALLEVSILRTGWAAGAAGLGGLLLAAATAAVGFWSKHGAEISRQVVRWRDRLGKGAMEIAALLTLVGASLLMNLLIAYAISTYTHPAPSSADTIRVPACASSMRGEVSGSAVSAVYGVSCETAMLIMDDMSTQGFPSADIEAARNRYIACCALEPSLEMAKEHRELCATGATATGASPDHLGRPADPLPAAVNTLCPLPPQADKKGSGAGAGDGKGNAAAKRPEIRLAAMLPVSLQLAIDYRIGLRQATAPWLTMVIVALLLFSLLMSGMARADTYSLQAMYANRLTRAYLGASNPDRSKADPFSGFNAGDDLPLHQLAEIRPELVINAALNLTKVEQQYLALQQRKALAFTMSAQRCALNESSMTPSEEYRIDGTPISLGQAISISGAAVAPNMGYHSSPAVTAVLALFNLRLGRWLPNPGRPSNGQGLGALRALLAVLNELRSSVGIGGDHVYVSDGGHFENLGVYSMLQRKCELIVAVDAGADPDYEFEDVENLVRKARVDLGIEIEIADVQRCMALIRSGRLRYLYGSIRYPDGSGGELIILKPVLRGDEPYDVTRYAQTVHKAGSVFPQQTTADQFFDEAQFESYRILGRHTVRQVFGSGGKGPGAPIVTPPEPQGEVAISGSISEQSQSATNRVTESASGLIGSAAEAAKSLGSMGQAVLLASAVTLTGVVGVSGVVSLKDTTVSIDDQSLTRIENAAQTLAMQTGTIRFDGESLQKLEQWSAAGIKVKTEELKGRLSLDPVVIDWGATTRNPEFANAMDLLVAKLEEIIVTIKPDSDQTFNVRITQTGPAGGDDLEVLRQLTNQLASSSQSLVGSSGRLESAVTLLQTTVDQFASAVEAGDPKRILAAVESMNVSLGDIRQSVEAISPRNTVRSGQ